VQNNDMHREGKERGMSGKGEESWVNSQGKSSIEERGRRGGPERPRQEKKKNGTNYNLIIRLRRRTWTGLWRSLEGGKRDCPYATRDGGDYSVMGEEIGKKK